MDKLGASSNCRYRSVHLRLLDADAHVQPRFGGDIECFFAFFGYGIDFSGPPRHCFLVIGDITTFFELSQNRVERSRRWGAASIGYAFDSLVDFVSVHGFVGDNAKHEEFGHAHADQAVPIVLARIIDLCLVRTA